MLPKFASEYIFLYFMCLTQLIESTVFILKTLLIKKKVFYFVEVENKQDKKIVEINY